MGKKRNEEFDRRDFLKLSGMGVGVFFASGLGFPGLLKSNKAFAESPAQDFYFLQLSDTHWGFEDPKINPEAKTTLKKAIKTINSLAIKPDFIVFTGDLSHTTADDKERRQRLLEFKKIAETLKVKNIRYLPGEHDAALDEGKAYREIFGDTHYSFSHKGIHFIAIDNVSDSTSSVGETQRAWIKSELDKLKKDTPIVVLTHRPLFDLMPEWDWTTRDGKQVMDLFMPYENVVVFYGHIHQENHFTTGHIQHHSAKGLMFPFPAPGSVPKRAPIPWDAKAPFKGLGFRSIDDKKGKVAEIKEWNVTGS